MVNLKKFDCDLSNNLGRKPGKILLELSPLPNSMLVAREM